MRIVQLARPSMRRATENPPVGPPAPTKRACSAGMASVTSDSRVVPGGMSRGSMEVSIDGECTTLACKLESSAMARVMNFNPGPAALPLVALERARDELIDFA